MASSNVSFQVFSKQPVSLTSTLSRPQLVLITVFVSSAALIAKPLDGVVPSAALTDVQDIVAFWRLFDLQRRKEGLQETKHAFQQATAGTEDMHVLQRCSLRSNLAK